MNPNVEFNFDFVELIEEKNLNKLLKDVKEELLADCIDIQIIISEIKNEEILFEYLINYTSKYCFFIYHFQKSEEFESCAEIKKFFMVMVKSYFNVNNEILEQMMIDSVTSYENL